MLQGLGFYRTRLTHHSKPKSWVDWNAEPLASTIKRLNGAGSDGISFYMLDDAAFHTGWGEILAQALGCSVVSKSQATGQSTCVGDGNVNGTAFGVYASDSPDEWLRNVLGFPLLARRR